MERNGAILIFHDDNHYVLKEIKSFLNTNGYEIHLDGHQFSTTDEQRNQGKNGNPPIELYLHYLSLHRIVID
jgi:hypothetical protein